MDWVAQAVSASTYAVMAVGFAFLAATRTWWRLVYAATALHFGVRIVWAATLVVDSDILAPFFLRATRTTSTLVALAFVFHSWRYYRRRNNR